MQPTLMINLREDLFILAPKARCSISLGAISDVQQSHFLHLTQLNTDCLSFAEQY